MKKMRLHAMLSILISRPVFALWVLLISGIWGQAYSQSLTKEVTLKLEEVAIIDFLDSLEATSGIKFVYSASVVPVTQKISVDYSQAPLEDVLTQVLGQQGIDFNEINDRIVLFKVESAAFTPPSTIIGKAEMYLSLLIKGKVVDAEGIGIPGVTIILKGTNLGTTTDVDGNYRFDIPDNQGDGVLVFSFVGYKTQEVSLNNETMVDVKMEEDLNTLDEVVVNGYQEIRKESFTGTTVTVSGEDIKQANPVNVLQALQLFDPSFRIQQNNIAGSDPNSLPNITVRGSTALPSNGVGGSEDDFNLSRSSLDNNPNLPTFILDGFQVNVQTIFDLNINRIASITILKDAASTAVYGSRASNGVVVITTKAPEAGKLNLTYTADVNVYIPDLSPYEVLNASEKLDYEVQAGLYNSEINAYGQTPHELDLVYYEKRKNVLRGVDSYWLSEPVEITIGSNHSLFLEGGTKSLRYGVTGRYQKVAGVMKGSDRERYGGDIMLNYNLNDRLYFNNTLTVTGVKSEASPYGYFSEYVKMNPYYPKTDEDGNILQSVDSWGRYDDDINGNVLESVLNPAYDASLSNFDQERYTQVINNFMIRWKLIENLEIRSQLSLNKMLGERDRYKSPFSNEYFSYSGGDLKKRGRYDYATSNEVIYDGNMVLVYNTTLNESHFINASVGSNVRSNTIENKSFVATGFTSDRFTNIAFANSYEENASPEGSTTIDRLLGYFASVNYSFQDKYLFDFSSRLDGSSKFGTDNKFAPFWAAGIGWNLHQEAFLKNNAVINRLRVRGTTGVTGEVSFPPYMSKTTYQYHSNWYSTGVGATNMGYGNENLKWQKTKNYDLGIELGMFKSRLFFQPRVYYRLTEDMLADVIVPPSIGVESYKSNLGVMENKGFEALFRANVIQSKNGWFVGVFANVAHNQNTIKEISESLKKYNDEIDDEQENSDNWGKVYVRYKEGESLNTLYAVPSMGIDPETGAEIYLKRDGTLTYEYDVKDQEPVGVNAPVVDGSFGANAAYKGFYLSLNFYTQLGADMYNQTLVDRVENADPRFNVDKRVYDLRWKNPGDVAQFKDITDYGQTRTTSRFIQPDDFVELKSASLSYESYNKLAKSIKAQSLRFTLTANDIWRWSAVRKERGIDYPFSRMVTLSVQAKF